MPRRFIAIGDVHGRLEPFVNMLRHAGLVNTYSEWCGGNARLLQIGDTVDRGPHSLQVDDILDRLQVQAAKVGGEVIRLVGNHELELILGNFDISQIPIERLQMLQQKLIRQVEDRKIKAAHAYKGFLFTHAGVSRRLMQVFDNHLEDLSAANLAILINFIFKESIAYRFYKHPIFNISFRRAGTSRYGGIFWEDLTDLIQSYRQSPVWQVVGHTPIDHIVIDRRQQIIPIDIGLHRKQQYLEISPEGEPTIVTVKE